MTAGYLGIDIGLSGARAAVISRRGRLLAHASISQANGNLTPQRLCSLMVHTVRRALSTGPDVAIAGIAVCAFGPTPVFLDGEGKVLKHLALFSAQPPQRGAGGEEPEDDDLALRVKTFRRAEPRLFAKARLVCDLTGYLVSRLTGRLAMDHVTAEDYGRFSLPRHIALPARLAAQDEAGGLTASAARRLGLSPGIPVAAGTYDSIADLAAAGFGRERKAVIIAGSTLVIGTLTKHRLRDGTLRSMPHLGTGWFSGGWTNSAGTSLGLAERLVAKGGKGHPAATPLLLPYFAGERAPVWSRQATGVIAGLTAATSATDLRAAFVQGVALSAADIASRLAAECGAIRSWTVTGGGSRNPLLMAALADALGARLSVVRGADQNIGPALLAARCCGAGVRLPIARRWRGDPAMHRAYMEKLRVYRQVYQAIRPLMGEISRVTALGRKAS